MVQDHESISWRCMKCVTHQQAKNVRNVAADEKKSVHDFLTVPLGIYGPPKDCVDLFVDYLEALHLEDKEKTEMLLGKLEEFKMEDEDEKKKKKAKKTVSKKRKKDEECDCHLIDEQIRDDITLLQLFSVGELRELLKHHKKDSEGTKPGNNFFI